MRVLHSPIHNGTRYTDGENRFCVDVTNDQRFFTIYDGYGEPCGTITRPLVLDHNGKWSSHLPNGIACTDRAVGPLTAFRSFLMAYLE